MSDASSNRRRQSSRLQRRAPASIEVKRCSDWNVAIPLLSPLACSPPSINRTTEIDSRFEAAPQTTSSKFEHPVVFKKWQHPAAPFCYDIAPSIANFGSCR
ncbi:hypothetical protein BVRB_3g056810 [Beta vulgaris subsp. vulgaris]|nr:hypothetical protein BVRB_3g056810 [Beta vulgaris subsp. vulgaris]